MAVEGKTLRNLEKGIFRARVENATRKVKSIQSLLFQSSIRKHREWNSTLVSKYITALNIFIFNNGAACNSQCSPINQSIKIKQLFCAS